MSCDPERVTALVDGALPDSERLELQAHLPACETCRRQLAEERQVRALLKALPEPEPRPSLELDVRRRLRAARPGRLRYLLPLAAGLAAVVILGLGRAPVLAWQLAYDHDHCFSAPVLPAEVWSSDPAVVRSHFAREGREIPALPGRAGVLELVGARRCPLLDRSLAHLYYSGDGAGLSVFVVPGRVGLDRRWSGRLRGHDVRLLRVGGAVVGVVGPAAAAEAFETSLVHTTAALRFAEPGV